jgi:hypothetical protein
MVQACLGRKIEPFRELYLYGCELYRLVDFSVEHSWVGDFSEEQRSWIEQAARSAPPDTVAQRISMRSAST